MSAAHRTAGEIAGRIADLTIKLYMVQEKVIEAARSYQPLSAENAEKLFTLNIERNRAMTALDELVDRAVREGKADIDPRVKLTDS